MEVVNISNKAYLRHNVSCWNIWHSLFETHDASCWYIW